MSDLFPDTEPAFRALQESSRLHVDLEARFPAWPFKRQCGYVAIFEFDRILGGDFGNVVASLVETYRDSDVITIAIEPQSTYYRSGYGIFPAFQISGSRIREQYGAALNSEPGGDPTGALGVSVSILAVTGSSGAWAIFGQRDWEIGLLVTQDPGGNWLSTGVPWCEPGINLDSVRSPDGWGMPLSASDLESFSQTLRDHGTKPYPRVNS